MVSRGPHKPETAGSNPAPAIEFSTDCFPINGVNQMLVLSRKKNESIVINEDITLVVVEIRGDKVRLGIEADRSVPVHRQEVFDAILRHRKKVKAANQEESPSAASTD